MSNVLGMRIGIWKISTIKIQSYDENDTLKVQKSKRSLNVLVLTLQDTLYFAVKSNVFSLLITGYEIK